MSMMLFELEYLSAFWFEALICLLKLIKYLLLHFISNYIISFLKTKLFLKEEFSKSSVAKPIFTTGLDYLLE